LVTFIAASIMALVAAAIIAPLIAIAVVAAGFNLPFPRIFDRVVMVTLFAALLLFARGLKLLDLLRQSFTTEQASISQTLGGLALATGAVGVLFALAAVVGGHLRASVIAASVLAYLPAAILIAVIEEGFFRAFLLAGMENEVGSLGGLLASSAIFGLIHVIRSPAHFYLEQFDPMAGARTLAAYAERIVHIEVGPPLLGFSLLGVVLGEAFVLTRRVYCSVGLHVGFVLGAKTWRLAVAGIIPRWLAGPGSVPLVAAPAAWVMSAVVLTVLVLWLGPGRPDVHLSRRHSHRLPGARQQRGA
jgi:membrane protease YdiL (CAAX protease family)